MYEFLRLADLFEYEVKIKIPWSNILDPIIGPWAGCSSPPSAFEAADGINRHGATPHMRLPSWPQRMAIHAADTKICCLATDAFVREWLARGYTWQCSGWHSNPAPLDQESDALTTRLLSQISMPSKFESSFSCMHLGQLVPSSSSVIILENWSKRFGFEHLSCRHAMHWTHAGLYIFVFSLTSVFRHRLLRLRIKVWLFTRRLANHKHATENFSHCQICAFIHHQQQTYTKSNGKRQETEQIWEAITTTSKLPNTDKTS